MHRYPYILLLSVAIIICSAAQVLSAPLVDADLDRMSRRSTTDLINESHLAYEAGDHDRALRMLAILATRYDTDADIETQRGFARCFDIQGTILNSRGAYSSAMDSYMKARKIAESRSLDMELATVLGHIGNIYASNADYSSATDFYLRALTMAEQNTATDSRGLRAMLYSNLTGTYHMRGIQDSARIYAARFEQLGPDHSDDRYEYDLLLNKALLSDDSGHHDTARQYYRKAVAYAVSNSLEPLYAGAAYSMMSNSFQASGMTDSAILYMERAHNLATAGGHGTEMVEALGGLAGLYSSLGKRDMAMKYKMRQLEVADSIRLTEERDKLKTSEMLYTIDSNASTIQNLNAIRAAQWRWLVALTLALIVFTLLAVVLYRQKQALKLAWNSLYERNSRQLETDMAHRDTIRRLEMELADTRAQLAENLAATTGDVSGGREKTGQEKTGGDTPEESPAENRTLTLSDELKQHLAKQITEVMEQSDLFCQPDFSLERLAAAIDSNPRYVSEVVNQVMGCTFRAMLNEYRVKRAMLKLSDTANYGHLTIKAIGESVGYRSQSTFISVFTRQTGLKPSLYHRLARERDQQ